MVKLYFYQHQLALICFAKHIYHKLFLLISIFIGFRLKQFYYGHLAFKQRLKKAFQHSKVGFAAQQTLDGPIEADELAGVYGLLFPDFDTGTPKIKD
jgi:hypothetical protein